MTEVSQYPLLVEFIFHSQGFNRRGSDGSVIDSTIEAQHGAIFVQTACDYPPVEVIVQNVVKHHILPDLSSKGRRRYAVVEIA